MNLDRVIFSEYEQQRGEELIAYTREKNLKIQHEEELAEARKKALESGFSEGIEKGISQGIEQGIKKGIEQEKIEMIKSMLENKADYEFISKVSGKSIDEIKEIEKIGS